MNTLGRYLLVIASLVLVQNSVYAGGCHLEEVTLSKAKASEYLSLVILKKLKEIVDAMEKRGEKLDAVLIARAGESLDGLGVIKDDPSVPLQTYLDGLADLAIKNGKNNSSGGPKNNQPKNREQVPRNLILKERLQFSHFGILLRYNPEKPNAIPWSYMSHLLANCDKNNNRYGKSSIWRQPFAEFFWDTELLEIKASTNKALLVVPTPQVQSRLLKLVLDQQNSSALHEPTYNVAATPFTLRSAGERKREAPDFHQLRNQNSNQWPVEMIAAATRPFGEVQSRTAAQDILFKTNFRPSILDPLGIKETAACALKRGPFGIWDASNLINCDTQAFRKQNIVQLITVNSVVDYMSRNNFLAAHISDSKQKGVYIVEGDRAFLERLKKIDNLTVVGELAKQMVTSQGEAQK